MERECVLIRLHREPKQILGLLFVLQDTKVIFSAKTLELPWRRNKPNASCVPAGSYPLIWEYSNKFKRFLYELKGVPGRSESKVHPLNHYWQTNGCVGLGDMHLRLDPDKYRDLRNSAETVDRFHEAMAGVRVSRIKIFE